MPQHRRNCTRTRAPIVAAHPLHRLVALRSRQAEFVERRGLARHRPGRARDDTLHDLDAATAEHTFAVVDEHRLRSTGLRAAPHGTRPYSDGAMIARLATRRTVLLTVAVALGVVLMLNLAAWQWDRHVARREFNAALVARLGDPAVPLADVLVLDPADAEWRTANAVGEYVDGADLRVVNRSQDGRAGTNAVSLLRLEDGSFVYVVRGFLPLDLEPSAPPAGRVEVTGRVRISDERRTGEVSDPASGVLTEVQRLDLGRLASQVPGALAAVSLDLVASSPADDPRLATVALPGTDLGPHLSYMVQWILFSAAAIVGWVLVVRRELRRTPRRDD